MTSVKTDISLGLFLARSGNALKEAHIDFVHEKRHMDVGGRGVGACDVSR